MKIRNVNIEIADNGVIVNGSYLTDSYNDGFRMIFSTITEASDFVNSQFATPEDVQAWREDQRSRINSAMTEKQAVLGRPYPN